MIATLRGKKCGLQLSMDWLIQAAIRDREDGGNIYTFAAEFPTMVCGLLGLEGSSADFVPRPLPNFGFEVDLRWRSSRGHKWLT